MGDLPPSLREHVDLRFLWWHERIHLLRSESRKWHRMMVATLNSSLSSPSEQLIAGLAVLCSSIARNITSSSDIEICMSHMQRFLNDVEKQIDYSSHDVILVSFAKFVLAFFSSCVSKKRHKNCVLKKRRNLKSRLATLRYNAGKMEYGKKVLFMCSRRDGADDQLIHRITAFLLECAQSTTRIDKRWRVHKQNSLRYMIGVIDDQAAGGGLSEQHQTLCAFARLFVVACDVALLDSPPITISDSSTAGSEWPEESRLTIREQEYEKERTSSLSEVKEELDEEQLQLSSQVTTASTSSEMKMDVDQVKLEPENDTPENYTPVGFSHDGAVDAGDPELNSVGEQQLSDDAKERANSSSSTVLLASMTLPNDSLGVMKEEKEEKEEEHERGEENGLASCSFESTNNKDCNVSQELPLLENRRTVPMATIATGFRIRTFYGFSVRQKTPLARYRALVARDGISIERLATKWTAGRRFAFRPTTTRDLAIRSTTSLADISTGTLIALYCISMTADIMARTIYGLIGEREPAGAHDFTRATQLLKRAAHKAMVQEKAFLGCSGEIVCGNGEIVRDIVKIHIARNAFYSSRVDVRGIVGVRPRTKQAPKCDPPMKSRSIDTANLHSTLQFRERTLSNLYKDEHSYSRVHPKAIDKAANVLKNP